MLVVCWSITLRGAPPAVGPLYLLQRRCGSGCSTCVRGRCCCATSPLKRSTACTYVARTWRRKVGQPIALVDALAVVGLYCVAAEMHAQCCCAFSALKASGPACCPSCRGAGAVQPGGRHCHSAAPQALQAAHHFRQRQQGPWPRGRLHHGRAAQTAVSSGRAAIG